MMYKHMDTRLGTTKNGSPIRALCTNIWTNVWELQRIVPRRVSVYLYMKRGLVSFLSRTNVCRWFYKFVPGKKIAHGRGTIGISAIAVKERQLRKFTRKIHCDTYLNNFKCSAICNF